MSETIGDVLKAMRDKAGSQLGSTRTWADRLEAAVRTVPERVLPSDFPSWDPYGVNENLRAELGVDDEA